jgi:hypothetical protein
MPLYNSLDHFSKQPVAQSRVDTRDEIPKELNIYYRQESAFLPEGKKIEDLTPEELQKLKNQYRFDYFVPGLYQTLTGIGKMI